MATDERKRIAPSLTPGERRELSDYLAKKGAKPTTWVSEIVRKEMRAAREGLAVEVLTQDERDVLSALRKLARFSDGSQAAVRVVLGLANDIEPIRRQLVEFSEGYLRSVAGLRLLVAAAPPTPESEASKATVRSRKGRE